MSFFITHENDNLDEYTAFDVNGGGAISTSAAAAMNSTNFGFQSTVAGDGDVAVAYLDYVAFGGTQYIITFWFDPNSISMPTVNPTDWTDEDVTIFRLGLGNSGRLVVELQYNGTSYVVRCYIRDDALALISISDTLISDTKQLFQIAVTKAATAGSNDGILEFSINGIVQDTVSNVDIFTRYDDPNRIRMGLDDLVGEPNISGTCYFDQITGGGLTAASDEFILPFTFIENQGAGAAGGVGGGDNPASRSVDGLHIYIAAFNSLGFPTLIKILTDLSADGSIVFNPGAGGRIGVQCGTFNAEHLWVAGRFDGTKRVEKSENAGSTFTVKDDGSFGAIRTFEVGPGSDTTVLVFDGDNGDIIETIDDGVIWITINASVTPLINAMSKLSKNLEETVFINQGGVTDSIDYSVNSGANLKDFQTGVYPNANGTGVVVS